MSDWTRERHEALKEWIDRDKTRRNWVGAEFHLRDAIAEIERLRIRNTLFEHGLIHIRDSFPCKYETPCAHCLVDMVLREAENMKKEGKIE